MQVPMASTRILGLKRGVRNRLAWRGALRVRLAGISSKRLAAHPRLDGRFEAPWNRTNRKR